MYNQTPPGNYTGNYYQQTPNQYENQYQRFTAPMNVQSQMFLKGRPVVSIEEARAAQIDLDGSLHVFTDIGNKKIYTKQINLDGTATLNIYNLQEEQAPIEQVEFVTKAEFNEEMNKMQSLLNNLLIPKENEKVSLNNF